MNNFYTSLELSKNLKAAGCELQTNWNYSFNYSKGEIGEYEIAEFSKGDQNHPIFPAYHILEDICVKRADEFWGEDIRQEGSSMSYSPSMDHSIRVFQLLRCEGKEEAEDYILEHCLFNPKNS